MSDDDKDARRIGRDEMNLCEHPIALLADRVPEGCKTMVFEDRHGRLTVSGSDAHGLPTAPDADVIVGLIQLTKLRNDFTDSTVKFTRYELLRAAGLARSNPVLPQARRVAQPLGRRDAVLRRVLVEQRGQVLGRREVPHPRECRHLRPGGSPLAPGEQQPLPLSSFTWNKMFFASCQANNLKQLDLGVYFGLKSAVSKQLFRFLDKRFYHRGDLTFDLEELAFEHVGLSRTYSDAGRLKAKLQPALEELEAIGFLEPMTAADRYSKTGRGAWNIRLVRKLPAPAKAKLPPPEPEPTGLEKELVERGVTRSVAADLVHDFPADRITAQLEQLDWLRETKPKRVKDVGAYLADAIRKDFAAPAGFQSQAARAEAEATARAQQEQEERARQAKARAQRSRRRSRRTGRSRPPTSRSGSRPRRWPVPLPPTARRTRRRRGPPAGCSRSACATPTSDACSACPRRTDPRGRPGTPRSPATGPGAAGTTDPTAPTSAGPPGAGQGPSPGRRGGGQDVRSGGARGETAAGVTRTPPGAGTT